MRCKNCGTENPDGSKFCATCGKPLEQEEPAKNVAEQKEEADPECRRAERRGRPEYRRDANKYSRNKITHT